MAGQLVGSEGTTHPLESLDQSHGNWERWVSKMSRHHRRANAALPGRGSGRAHLLVEVVGQIAEEMNHIYGAHRPDIHFAPLTSGSTFTLELVMDSSPFRFPMLDRPLHQRISFLQAIGTSGLQFSGNAPANHRCSRKWLCVTRAFSSLLQFPDYDGFVVSVSLAGVGVHADSAGSPAAGGRFPAASGRVHELRKSGAASSRPWFPRMLSSPFSRLPSRFRCQTALP